MPNGFEADLLLDKPLPSGIRRHTESWQGSILEYAVLVGDPAAEEKLLAYDRAVYEVAAPTLLA